MKNNLNLLLVTFLLMLIPICPVYADSHISGDDPFEGFDEARDIENNLIEGDFGEVYDFGFQYHWYVLQTIDGGWFECEILDGDANPYIEFYDGDEFLLSMEGCSDGDGARFFIDNSLNIRFKGLVGQYEMSVNPWEIGQAYLDSFEADGFTLESDYMEFFGRHEGDMHDHLFLGPAYEPYLKVDFSYGDSEIVSAVDILVSLQPGDCTGSRRVNLISEGRITIDRTPDEFFYFMVYGDEGGQYILRCQGQ